MGNIGIWQLLMIAVIVVVVFGTNKLRTFGSDLGAAIKGFKKAMNDNDGKSQSTLEQHDADFQGNTPPENQVSEMKQDNAKRNKEDQV
ncbi:twin-arginine translocase TatA/TatE family subunit [Enterobacteriaceae bacterium LUAb1]